MSKELGELSEWSTTDYLLALIADSLAAANWQRSGGRGSRPKALKRPGQKQDTGQQKRIGGGGRLSMDEAREKFFTREEAADG